ncbi:hypothetical protein BBOMB_0587 [Bifidobacterium bombi DSM 19703]|uniref:Uncharacterized protein n=1 Tax=Bifidobacterium bombi DSM 19703 TaxID=1341695 RepID=A0A080N2L9_9BIFI|nr:hypothetical protein BBOMB_0587 [Bifidobacterium bombi DSM 19703]
MLARLSFRRATLNCVKSDDAVDFLLLSLRT